MHLRTTIPFTRFNSDLILSDDQRAVLVKHFASFVDKSYVDLSQISGSANDQQTWFDAPFLHKSFVFVITETVGEYPYPYFSEKTWKSIITGCPFIMVNAQHSLVKLKEFGFKTFNHWWDESYDNKITVADRIETITKILSDLSNLSINELSAIRQQMSATIEHNKAHLEIFTKADLENITNKI